jgi:hypothetical protein
MKKLIVDYRTRRLSDAVIRVDVPIKENKDWNWKILLLSDLHFDHPRCNRKLLKRLLQQAIDINAGIVITGDVFCAMSSRLDKRWLRSEVLPEYISSDNLFSDMISDCASFLEFAASNLILVSEGNHETKIVKTLDRVMIDDLTDKLNEGKPYHVHTGRYAGLIDIDFQRANGCTVDSKLWSFHHGGYTTESAKISRMQYYPDVDMFSSGHNHDLDIKPYARVRMLPSGELYKDHQWFVQVPSLKDDFGDGTTGFAVEARHRPKVLGCVWWDFNFLRETKRVTVRPIPCV